MPTVEYRGGNRLSIHQVGRFTHGDQADVSADQAAYLVDARGDFVVVTEDDEEYVCEDCGDTFDSPQGLAAHARVHEED